MNKEATSVPLSLVNKQNVGTLANFFSLQIFLGKLHFVDQINGKDTENTKVRMHFL
jgi:hypothetical protein